MKSKSLIALSILCLALGACASTSDDDITAPVAQPENHANQSSPAARTDVVGYTTLTPGTEVKTVTTTSTEPVWSSTVENPSTASTTLTESSSSTTVSGTSGTGTSTTVDNTATIAGTGTVSSNTTKTTTTTTTASTSGSMASSSTLDDDDDDVVESTATTTRTRMRKD
jgi:hypothetical protein